MIGMAPARLITIGLRTSALSDAAVPEMAMPRVNWTIDSVRKNATAKASPCSPNAYRLIGRPMLPVLGNMNAGSSTRQCWPETRLTNSPASAMPTVHSRQAMAMLVKAVGLSSVRLRVDSTSEGVPTVITSRAMNSVG
ncbi:hypothetical protein D3C80_1594550 [compost metagenome]